MCLTNFSIFWDPFAVEQYGEGNFKLGDIKMVETTDDYYSLDEETRGCQAGSSSLEDCVTEKYLEALIVKCSCLPYSLQNYTNSDKEVIVEDSNILD